MIRPDFSDLTDSEVHRLAAAAYDVNALMLMLIKNGLVNADGSFDVGHAIDVLDGELKMRLAMRKAVRRPAKGGA